MRQLPLVRALLFRMHNHYKGERNQAMTTKKRPILAKCNGLSRVVTRFRFTLNTLLGYDAIRSGTSGGAIRIVGTKK